MNIPELLQKRAKLIADARAILDTASKEKRALTQEEQNNYDAAFTAANDLGETIQRAEQQTAIERSLADSYQPGDTGNTERAAYEFRSRSMAGLESRNLGNLTRLAAPEYGAAFNAWTRYNETPAERRALQADLDTAGGNLYAPLQFVDRLIQAVDDAVYLRQWATVLSVTDGESLGVPSLDADPADADWTTELATGSEDSTMAFGKRELNPHPLAKRIKVSRKLLRKAPRADELVMSRLAYKFGITFEKALLTGNGAQQPLGVFTASAQGISTGRDVSTGNTTTAMTMDGLYEAKYALKQNYWPRARWLMHRTGVKAIAKLKDGEGRYLWQESTRVGEPDRLLGIPLFMSEYAPSTFTSQLYVGILGDFSNYWIADSLLMEMIRLNELYAETNQVGMIGRMESDGLPVLEEAFVRVKLA
jgi:HK97 family phage major capsid protein